MIFFFFNFYFILLYNTVLVLPYIDMNPLRVYGISKHKPPSHLPPHNISLGHPRAPAPSILYPVSNINDTPFLQLFLKFSLCRVSLAVGLSLLAVGGLLTAVPLLLHTSGFSPLFRTRVTLCSEIKVSSLQVGPGNPLSQPRGAPW